MLETRPDRLGEGLGKFKAEEQGAGGKGGGVIQASPVRTGGEQGQAEVCAPELAELCSCGDKEGGAHRGDFIPGAGAGPGQPRKLRSGDLRGCLPWHLVSEGGDLA